MKTIGLCLVFLLPGAAFASPDDQQRAECVEAQARCEERCHVREDLDDDAAAACYLTCAERGERCLPPASPL